MWAAIAGEENRFTRRRSSMVARLERLFRVPTDLRARLRRFGPPNDDATSPSHSFRPRARAALFIIGNVSAGKCAGAVKYISR